MRSSVVYKFLTENSLSNPASESNILPKRLIILMEGRLKIFLSASMIKQESEHTSSEHNYQATDIFAADDQPG